ncbi:MAG: 50S ribosomal protein L6 [Candidatus Eisenbacteria bacterium]|uniref:Large ribosomal subunit protein uL6 n=1 Tax=Eiseniibacteriota bacterium TaxID=2212470 RepID=A0A948W647_UNCEI|nr:50S ribosomal protein L6 [Candidatus Eisenbacteria bacterium]MBU2691134.1 50S ribosomal protein L6 [Candidatus Eisenbacteria bacterium]
MSRIGKLPIEIPKGVEIRQEGQRINVKGPKGEMTWTLPRGINIRRDGETLFVEDNLGTNEGRALHGANRSHVANLITGVTAGYAKVLEIIGVGYRAQMEGKNLILNLRYNHPIVFPVPDGVTAEVTDRPLKIKISGIDKVVIGQTAANIRAIQKPDPYKGKGIRYEGEQVRKKAGKSAG